MGGFTPEDEKLTGGVAGGSILGAWLSLSRHCFASWRKTLYFLTVLITPDADLYCAVPMFSA